MLTPGAREGGGFRFARSFSYFTLLVEPTSTLSQVFDMPFSFARAGVSNSFVAMFSKKIGIDSIGIDAKRVSEEFRDPLFMDKALRLGLRATGFTRLDQFMKETNITANFRRFRKMSKAAPNTPNGRKFNAEMTFMGFNDAEVIQFKAALQKGDANNPLVRLALFSRLAETQPLTKAQMPLAQAENPNLRFLYTMKSFLVNQVNLTNDLYLRKIFSRDGTVSKAERTEAILGLFKLVTFMAAVGVPVDMLKDLVAGRLGYLPDYAFNNTVRLFGVSRYTAYTAQKEGVGMALLDFFTPVAIQQFTDVTFSAQKLMAGEPIQKTDIITLAPLSDVLNRIFGFTREREQKEYRRRLREGERPFVVPPGTL